MASGWPDAKQNIRHQGFAPFLQAEVYDVMMPDVKYAGGLMEMIGLSKTMAESGVEFSPHNPSGPISHAASLHVAAAAVNFTMLECQFDETPWFDRLRGTPLPAPVRGDVSLPAGAGIGRRSRFRGAGAMPPRPVARALNSQIATRPYQNENKT